MSKTRVGFVRCEKCNNSFKIEAYLSINSEQGDVINKIRNESVMQFECPHCKYINYINHSILYNDIKDKFMIQYANDLEDILAFIHANEEMKDKFPNIFYEQKNRLVTEGYARFVEKIEIFKSNLNDKIIELYKFYLASAIEKKGFKDILFEASKDFTRYRFNVLYDNNEVEYYVFNRELYKELEEQFKEDNNFNRADDLIVNQMLIEKFLKNPNDPTLVHEELYLTERQHCIKVNIDSKKYWYKTDYIVGINTKVEVPFGKNILEGIVVDEKDVSEKELGFTFDKLKEPNKVFYTVDDIIEILENGVLDLTLSGATLYNADLDLTDEELNQYNEGDTLYYDNHLFAAEKLSKLDKNTRIAVISANPTRMDSFTNESKNGFNVATFINQYFKVIKKFEYNSKNFIILLHLPRSYWHILSANIEFKFDKSDVVDIAIERLQQKSFMESAPVLTAHPQWESLCKRINVEFSKNVDSNVVIF